MFIVSLLLAAIFAQDVVTLGSGSYASFPPAGVVNEDFYGNNYTGLSAKYNNDFYIVEESKNRPIPTNHWFTNFFFNKNGGTAWTWPQGLRMENANGVEVVVPIGFNGEGMTTAALSIQGTQSVPPTDDVLFADFETPTWPRGWTASDDVPYPGPITFAEANENPPPTGFGGNRFVSTLKGDGARGTLTSPDFVIQKKYIHLSVAGGNYPDETYVGLFINNQRVLSETGQQGPNLTPRVWDVTPYLGQSAQIRIVDNTGAGWGFILCDDIYFTDSEAPSDEFDTHFKAAKGSGVLDWTDIGFTYRSARFEAALDSTSVHGLPFEYFDFKEIVPTLHPAAAATFFDGDGKAVAFPARIDSFTIEFSGAVFGVHAPVGTLFENSGGDVAVTFPEEAAKYLVISTLPDRTFLNQYNEVARNRPTNTRFEYDVIPEKGELTTTFVIETKNYDTGAVGGNTIMTFLPHQYRNTTQDFKFIDGATYRNIRGLSKTGVPATSYTLTYAHTGFPPYLPAPLDLTTAQDGNLAHLITSNADGSAGYDENTYAKGLGEKTSIMLQAYARGEDASGDKIRANLITQFKNWLTYEKTETNKYFFTMYPEYGALIGFPSGYGSQGFNDLHFHYGYFVVGAARLMLVDEEFRTQFGPFVRFLAQDFANWQRYDTTKPKDDVANPFFPFLRTFDAYEGHSYAGGTGDGGGNNQESTSEALNSWWGIYLLGLALNDPIITKLGAVGHKLENTAAGEYWFDLYNENFPDTYQHEYCGILRSGSCAFGTYFSGDPGWVLGIQAVPVEFYYQPYGDVPANMKRVWEAMLEERIKEDGTNDAYANINNMDPYLGGYHLNLLATYDPETAAEYLDRLYAQGGGWTTHVNIATIYYVTHAYLTYGRPAKGYSTDLASGAVYENSKGELTYLIYNPADAPADVKIYKAGAVVDTVTVLPRTFFNSRQK